jgi:uncharacterized protein YraI
MTSSRFRRASLLLAVLMAVAALAAGCSPSTATNVDQNGNPCEHWCGSGSAQVTAAGATTTITGGGCYDQGSAGVDARFGDWQGLAAGDYLEVTGFQAGNATPTPVPTVNPKASPGETEHPGNTVDGSVNGAPFVLDTDTVVTLKADRNGTFRGTDLNGAGTISGTFSCG